MRPNQITHWKNQLIGNAENIFGKGGRLAEDSEHKIQELQSKIGQLTIENDLLEQELIKDSRPKRKVMVNPVHPLPITRQCQLLSLNRSMFYYQPKAASEEDGKLMC